MRNDEDCMKLWTMLQKSEQTSKYDLFSADTDTNQPMFKPHVSHHFISSIYFASYIPRTHIITASLYFIEQQKKIGQAILSTHSCYCRVCGGMSRHFFTVSIVLYFFYTIKTIASFIFFFIHRSKANQGPKGQLHQMKIKRANDKSSLG